MAATHTDVAAVSIYGTNKTERAGRITVGAQALTRDEWYDLYIQRKRFAMRRKLLESTRDWSKVLPVYGKNYEFTFGIFTYISSGTLSLKSYLKTVNECLPVESGNNLQMLGNRHVALTPQAESEKQLEGLAVNIPIVTRLLSRLFYDCYYMIWRLYHAYNYLIARLLVYDPFRQIHQFNEYPLGRCLGTLLEYQAQLTRWNHYVWLSALSVELEVINEKFAIKLGYRNAECCVRGVTVTAIISLANDADRLVTDNLTIFRNGVSTNLGELPGSLSAAADASSEIFKMVTAGSSASSDPSSESSSGSSLQPSWGSSLVDPSSISSSSSRSSSSGLVEETYRIEGFGKDPKGKGQWTDIKIVVKIPPMVKGEYYEEVFVLAIGYGEEADLSLPSDKAEIRYAQLTTEVTWEVDQGKCPEPGGAGSGVSSSNSSHKPSGSSLFPSWGYILVDPTAKPSSSGTDNPQSGSSSDPSSGNVAVYRKVYTHQLPLANVVEEQESSSSSEDPDEFEW